MCDESFIASALRQRNGLAIVVEHIFNVDRIRADVNDAIAAIDDLALAANKDIVAGGEKDLLGLVRLVGKAVELEIDGRRPRRRLRNRNRHRIWILGILRRW